MTSKPYRLLEWPESKTAVISISAVIASGIALVTIALYWAGGTGQLNPNLILVPIIIGGFYFGTLGGVVTAALAGMAIGPFMPLSPGLPQQFADWGLRIVFYAINGGVVGVLSTRVRAESERRLAEREERIQEATSRLGRTPELIEQERLRALGQMASGIVHDFNNVLAPITGYSELLLMRQELWADRELASSYVRRINEAAGHGAGIVERMRFFYKRADASDRPFLNVDLAQTISRVVELTEPQWKAQSRASGLQVSVEARCEPGIMVRANDVDLCSVLTNLIVNAVHSMPEGGQIKIDAEAHYEMAKILVIDTGTGMDPETLRRSTEAYFTTKPTGSGLGLALARQIIDAHGGQLHIESTVGVGTTVSIVLPLAAAVEVTESLGDPGPLGRSLRILVVDDDNLSQELIAEFLLRDGHSVVTAADGTEGLRMFQGDTFDLVISDDALPAMDGVTMLRTIRELSPNVPIVLATGFLDPIREGLGDDEAEMKRAVVLRKPISLASLRRALGAALNALS